METMTSENIKCASTSFIKKIKTENNNDYTKTIINLKGTQVWLKKLKQLSILNRINTQKQINDAV